MRRICLNLLWVLFAATTFSSCGSEKYEEVRYLPFREANLYGFIDRKGDVVIGPQFAYAFPFSQDLAAVNIGGTARNGDVPLDGKWGFINPYGEFVINPNYLSPPINRGAPFSTSQMAYIMHEAYQFREGLAAVYKDNAWVYIDSAENVKIDGSHFQSVRRFYNGLANVYVNDLWGYIDTTGTLVIEPQFLFPVNFEKDLVFVIDEKLNRFCIDRYGNHHGFQYRIEAPFHEEVTAFKLPWKGESAPTLEQELKYGLVDIHGQKLFEPQFDKIGRYGSGLAPVLIGSKQIEFLAYPEQIEPIKFEGGKWAFVNREGRIVFNPVYEAAKGYSQGLAAIRVHNRWGFIDTNRNWVVEPSFRWVGYFKDDMARVRLGSDAGAYDGQYAYINLDGEVFHILPRD